MPEDAADILAEGREVIDDHVTVHVGRDSERKSFQLSREVACNFSTLFREILKESSTIDLPNEDPATYELFHEWVRNPYTPLLSQVKDAVLKNYTCEPWISSTAKAWALGSKIGAPSFERFCLVVFIHTCALAPFGPWGWIEENVPQDSTLRRFSNHWVAWNCRWINAEKSEYAGLEAAKLATQISAQAPDPRLYGFPHWYRACGASLDGQCKHDPRVRNEKAEAIAKWKRKLENPSRCGPRGQSYETGRLTPPSSPAPIKAALKIRPTPPSRTTKPKYLLPSPQKAADGPQIKNPRVSTSSSARSSLTTSPPTPPTSASVQSVVSPTRAGPSHSADASSSGSNNGALGSPSTRVTVTSPISKSASAKPLSSKTTANGDANGSSSSRKGASSPSPKLLSNPTLATVAGQALSKAAPTRRSLPPPLTAKSELNLSTSPPSSATATPNRIQPPLRLRRQASASVLGSSPLKAVTSPLVSTNGQQPRPLRRLSPPRRNPPAPPSTPTSTFTSAASAARPARLSPPSRDPPAPPSTPTPTSTPVASTARPARLSRPSGPSVTTSPAVTTSLATPSSSKVATASIIKLQPTHPWFLGPHGVPSQPPSKPSASSTPTYGKSDPAPPAPSPIGQQLGSRPQISTLGSGRLNRMPSIDSTSIATTATATEKKKKPQSAFQRWVNRLS